MNRLTRSCSRSRSLSMRFMGYRAASISEVHKSSARKKKKKVVDFTGSLFPSLHTSVSATTVVNGDWLRFSSMIDGWDLWGYRWVQGPKSVGGFGCYLNETLSNPLGSINVIRLGLTTTFIFSNRSDHSPTPTKKGLRFSDLRPYEEVQRTPRE